MIDTDHSAPSQADAPAFPPLPASAQRAALKSEIRRIPIPPHRMTPLKKDWVNIFAPLTEMLQLQVRMNVQRKCVEIRVSSLILPRYNLILISPRDFQAYEGYWCHSERRRLCESLCVGLRCQCGSLLKPFASVPLIILCTGFNRPPSP